MANRLFPLSHSADPVRALSSAMQAKNWHRFNQLIAQGLGAGALDQDDLDLCPSKALHRLPSASGRLKPLYEKALAHKQEGSQEAFWLMHSWEAALKTGQLAQVTSEMKCATDASSTTLRRLFSGVRSLLKNVQCGYEHDQIIFKASTFGSDSAAGVTRLLYQLPNEIKWPGDLLEEHQQSSFFSNEGDCDGCVVRARLGSKVYIEGVDVSAYNDGGCIWWSSGTVFFSADAPSMDAFITKRSDLSNWESMVGLLDTYGQDGAKDEFVRLLSSPEGPDMIGEHRQATSRLLHHACAAVNEDAISALLAHGAHPGRMAHESQGPAWSLVEALDSHRIDVTSASVAACLNKLIGAGLDINETTHPLGQTLLLRAAKLRDGSVEMLNMLVSLGADPFVKDSRGQDLFEAVKTPTVPGEQGGYAPCALAFLDSLKAKISVDTMLKEMGPLRLSSAAP